MEFNSVAITAAGSGVDAVALEWLEHTIRTEVSSILRRNKGFRSCSGLGGWCEADSVLFDGAAAVGCRRTIGGILEASSSPPGLKVETEPFSLWPPADPGLASALSSHLSPN